MSDKEKKPKDDPTPETEREAPGADAAAKAGEASEDPAAERDRLMDRLMRLQAEFENYRRRVSREQVDWTSRAVERIVLDLLPVVDSFDRALKGAADAKEASAVLDGMILVKKQLLGALESHGVRPFESVGEAFDPNLHDAFMSRPAGPGEEPGTIVEEFVKGYRMGDRTIRPAQGIVAVAPEESPESGGDPEEE